MYSTNRYLGLGVAREVWFAKTAAGSWISLFLLETGFATQATAVVR
jgi:hypothetical protein